MVPAWALGENEAADGVRNALERGALAAVGLLGRADGFMGNPAVRIPLPPALKDAAKLLKTLGQGKRVDELVLAMNRAAEAAVPKAQALLVQTARQLSVKDALKMVRGGETSVTQYFEQKTRTPLSQQFLPIVTEATSKVSLATKYNAVAEKAMAFKLVKAEDAKLEPYVTAKALDGLFRLIGEEEKKIRRDPLATGSKLLRAVFGK
jgi:TRAP-type mannitol/chloroaromatic compound transport system substrate-binding protein